MHRDFKPANVLVGLDDRVRVTDFGLSRPGPTLELPATNSAVVTRDGAIVGTLASMAPEQLEGKLADERSDQFSFCVALVEALSGQRPFKGETWAELTRSLDAAPRFGTRISARLRVVLRKGLQRQPSHRYASMTALLNAIEGTRKPGWKWVALTGLAATIALGLISAQRMSTEQPSARTQAVQQNLVTVLIASVDVQEGTRLTIEMVSQRQMPSDYVTSSIVTPENAHYVIGQIIKVPVQKGDALLWTHFETELRPVVLTLARDVPEGTALTAPMLEEREVAAELATDSVVRPPDLSKVLGQSVSAPMKKGDLLLWSQLGKSAPKSALSRRELIDVVVSHHQELARCKALASRDGDLRLGWNVSAEGVPFEVALLTKEFEDDPGATCLVEAFENFRFPKKDSPTTGIDFPIRFVRAD